MGTPTKHKKCQLGLQCGNINSYILLPMSKAEVRRVNDVHSLIDAVGNTLKLGGVLCLYKSAIHSSPN